MAKKQKTTVRQANSPMAQHVPEVAGATKQKHPLSILDFKVQAVIIAVIGFVFYYNTFGNGPAFDDKIVLTQNEYVMAGFAGIPKILTGEAYESFSKQQKIGNPLSGGRYRPLSIVTFAIEQQFLGTTDVIAPDSKEGVDAIKAKQAKLVRDMHLRHVVNTIIYILTGIVLLWFLRKIVFPTLPLAAFVATLIFMVLPVHTEVVANIKSRDEILSLLFICLTFIYAFKHKETNKILDMVVAIVCYFLALLSKEYAVMLVVLLPLSFYLFKGYEPVKSIFSNFVFLIPLVVYFLLRFSSVTVTAAGAEDEIMNFPYLYATGSQAVASKFSVMLNYIQLLFFPVQLSADYSYNQIPYTDFSNPKVWLSIVVYTSMVIGMVLLIMKRHVLGFALAFYLVFFALVCNFIVNIGAPMGERFIFHSSVGFAIIIAWLLQKGYERIKQPQMANCGLVALLLVVIVLSGFKTIERNKDWGSDATLFLHDVNIVPNSIIANCNAAAACLDKEEETKDSVQKIKWLRKGIPYLDKALSLHKKYMLAYINRGIIYYKLNEYDKAMADCDSVRKYFPQHPSLAYLAYSLSDHYFKLGLENGRGNDPNGAIANFRKALEAMPADADIWYNLGYAYFSNNQFDDAKKAFINSLRIKPDHPQARNMLDQVKRQLEGR